MFAAGLDAELAVAAKPESTTDDKQPDNDTKPDNDRKDADSAKAAA